MKYGLYLAAAGALTSMHRQDVLSNNLANMSTVGYKPDVVALRQTPPERERSGVPTAPQVLLERLGGVVQADDTRPSMTQGELLKGTSPYDLAIQGDGFFVLEGGGLEDPVLTRDGRFTLDGAGRLVSAADGRAVLGTDGQPISVDPSRDVTVDGDGTIRQDDAIVASIAFVDPAPGAALHKAGNGTFRLRNPGPEALSLLPPDGEIHQSMIEASAVDPIATMNQLMAAAKSAQSNIKMMQFHDYLSGQAINTLGRV